MIASSICSLEADFAIKTTPAEFRRASLWLAKQADIFDIPDDQLYRLDSCLNEILANAMEHGGQDALEYPISLHFASYRESADGKSKATLTIITAGAKFDPFAVELAPRPTTLDDTQPGGLGLRMLRRFSDTQTYHYQAGRNQISCTVHWLER